MQVRTGDCRVKGLQSGPLGGSAKWLCAALGARNHTGVPGRVAQAFTTDPLMITN